MNEYEMTLLTRTDIGVDKAKHNSAETMRKVGVKAFKLEEIQEKFRLAYHVEGQEFSGRLFYTLKVREVETISELCDMLNNDKTVLRYLIVPIEKVKASKR